MKEFLASDANLIALSIFVALAAIGALMANLLARHGERTASLERRLKYAAARQGEDPLELAELAIDSELFNEVQEERKTDGRWAEFLGKLDHKLALIGGIGILRKAAPIAAGVGLIVALGLMLKLNMPLGLSFLSGAGVACAGLVLGLHFVLKRTYDKFEELFPDAIDLVVRSVRAGLPVSQALQNIGDDVPAPVGPEFARIASQMGIGVNLDDALHAALKRINQPEMRFFAVTLILQRETGGQLAEVLLSLSNTLRERKAMKMKINALTSESRAASKIVAAIPVLAGVGMYYLNEPSILMLFETEVGNMMLGYCIGSIVIGLGIIKKLTDVDA